MARTRVTAAYRANPTLSALVELSSGGVAPASLPADLGPSLARLGIFHVVVNTDSLGDVREPFETRGLHLVAEDGVRKLYAVRR